MPIEKKANKAIGCIRGGLNTKIYAIVDGLGNPAKFLLSAGNGHNSVRTIELLEIAGSAGVMFWQTALTVSRRFGNTAPSTRTTR